VRLDLPRVRGRPVSGRARTKARPKARPTPDYARIAQLEKQLGMALDTAKGIHPAVAARAGRGTQPTMVPLTEVINALTPPPGGTPARPMPRDPRDLVPFGPLGAMTPAPFDPPRRDTGRTEPRLAEYPPGWNLPGLDHRLIPWRVLRESARQVDILRRCIEVRKRHVASLKWAWTVSEDAVEQAMLDARGGATKRDVEADLRERLRPEIARLTAFWKKPWRSEGKDFKAWASMLLEEHLVLDAVAVYPKMTYGGDCLGLEIIAGDTIKPLRDYRGARPQPPYPAYQQILWGFPRGEYTATVTEGPDGSTLVSNGYPADQMYYYVGTPFASTPYGLSAVEQALVSARIYLKRQGWLLAEYDEGVTPQTWLVPPSNAAELLDEPFTVLKRREWEMAVNDELAGNTALRHRVKLTPPGFEPKQMANVAEQYKPDYDYFLIRILAAHMDVTLPEINITEPGGLGATGYHEGQEDVQDRVGTRPTVATIQDIVDDLSEQYLRKPPELTFKILGLESEDEAAQDAVAGDRVASGRMTLNEDRDRTGQPRYNFKEADMPMLQTQRGVVFLEGSSENAPAGQLIMPAQDMNPDAADPGGAPAPAEPESPSPGADEQDQAEQVAKAAEAATFKRWSAKRRGARNPGAPFEFRALSVYEAMNRRLLTFEDVGVLAVFKSAAHDDGDDADPKARPAAWPGWDVDLQAADHWAAQIAANLSGAVDGAALTAAFLTQFPPGGDTGTRNRAAQARIVASWLAARGLLALLTRPLSADLPGVWTDGYLIGAHAARALTAGTGADWVGLDWQPGQTTAAEQLLGQWGDGSGLRRMLADARVSITSIANSRLEDLARVLADAAIDGLNRGDATSAVRALIADPVKARRVAITELTRAGAEAAGATYQGAGRTTGRWLTEGDTKVCPICVANAKQGAVRLGEPFASGDIRPPGHPGCRCAYGPGDD
jgi:hypothetical protein